jgi:hypothetical protein
VLEKKARGRECLDALRQLYQVLLVYPRKYPSPHFRQLATTMYAFPLSSTLRARSRTHAGCGTNHPSCTTFTEAKLPNRLRALCSSIVQQCFDDEPEVFKRLRFADPARARAHNTRPLHERLTRTAWYSLSNRQLLEFILPATLALGGDSALTRHLPFFVQCVTTQDPVFRTSAFPGLILSRTCTDLPVG